MAEPSFRTTVAPRLMMPHPESVVDGRAVTFEWLPVPGASGYRFQIAYDEQFTEVEIETRVGDTTAFTVYDVLPIEGARMMWRVAADVDGEEIYSESRPIEIAVEHVPEPVAPKEEAERDPTVPEPVLPKPGELTDGLATTFEWQTAEEAAGYRFQLSDDASFSHVLLDTDVGDTNLLTVYDTLPLDGPELVWRVGALTGSDARWSKPANFSAVSDLAERVRQTAGNVARSVAQPGTANAQTLAVADTAAGQHSAMRLVWLWVVTTTAIALLIILKVMFA